ncbi:hypothetical protein J0X14_18770 [Muricauda sp. CAU 1633]|uniref:hypothetical protein n=1 Tax=Allomuricauda sp. CAU 1633 TaxID=2816036 RepID=UPI001A8D4C22|nr:hypothetical protein [Muricauda sp. CAU 1633]MBO0324358.1 hypothetical protein [Muricauda sp. CAU 1633]
MRKLLGVLLILLMLSGCKKNQESSQEIQTDELGFQYQKMPSKLTLNPEAIEIVEAWKEFVVFAASIDVLYKATNNEDLILAIDDLIEKEKQLAESTYPELFDTFRVKSRQQVLRTYLYKVKASLLENQETTAPTVEMLQAYNALRKQFNVIVNSQLDKELILDEN